MKLALYFHTLRYMRPIQIVDRIRRRLKKIDTQFDSPAVKRKVAGQWLKILLADSCMQDEREFVFLNKPGKLRQADDWNGPEYEKLWLYNLHYFEDLIATDAGQRTKLHANLVNLWIRENPPAYGVGWEPYPQSLRIVNWIKWFLNGQAPEPHWLQSLLLQVHVLAQSLEYHLLGNHLFANAKALIFAGLYFEGDYADKWLAKGLAIIDMEICEQVLDDGGNFELSTMYHAIMLHDVLDLLNVAQAYQHSAVNKRIYKWRNTAAAMLGWLDTMTHPDGEISFFNDAAMSIAPSPQQLNEYADCLHVERKLNAEKYHQTNVDITRLPDSGYIRAENSACVALLDCARVGPDYIPGHAHADTLSFEFSLYGHRVLVNSGTSCYGIGTERLRQRGTAAHNTVELDDRNSTEVWSGFRVARRARPSLPVVHVNNGISVCCSHDGYWQQGVRAIHERKWNFGKNSLQIVDKLSGSFSRAKARFHLHPDVKIKQHNDQPCYKLRLPTGDKARIFFETASELEQKESTWHPEFGKSIPSHLLEAGFSSDTLITTIKW